MPTTCSGPCSIYASDSRVKATVWVQFWCETDLQVVPEEPGSQTSAGHQPQCLLWGQEGRCFLPPAHPVGVEMGSCQLTEYLEHSWTQGQEDLQAVEGK